MWCYYLAMGLHHSNVQGTQLQHSLAGFQFKMPLVNNKNERSEGGIVPPEHLLTGSSEK